MQNGIFKLQMAVFALVSATFTCIYITQPVLPILQDEFGVGPVLVSLTVSAVILGIALANLPFGILADRYAIHPIIMTGGVCVALGGLICALTHDFKILVGARFLQGLFIPALTTCLAAWLAKTLPKERLSIVMGSYVSATIVGGLGGRLLGGWLHPPLHWRWALVSSAGLVIFTVIIALLALPKTGKPQAPSQTSGLGFWPLLKRRDLLLICFSGASGLLMFSSIFNFLPYRLAGPPFGLSTEIITSVYLVYIIGICLGPIAGRISNRFGAGHTLIAGTCMLGISFVLLLIPSIFAVVGGLMGVCAGFFTVHAVAVGLLNQKLSSGQGRANALYMLTYYGGSWLGITGAGFAFEQAGWPGVIAFVSIFLLIPLLTGWHERSHPPAD